MEINVQSPEIVTVPNIETTEVIYITNSEIPKNNQPETPTSSVTESKISALSLASIKAKRELQETHKTVVKETTHLPTEPFTETDMLLHWNRYAQKLGDKGFKIMESLLSINDPVLNGTSITIELPNEGSKIDFESEKMDY